MAKKKTGKSKKSYSYGKQSRLKWVLIYLVVGVVAYLLLYYIFLKPAGSSMMPVSY